MHNRDLRNLFLAMVAVAISSAPAFGQFVVSGEKREVTLKRRVYQNGTAASTLQDVTVSLPRGELDDISKYGSAGRWQEMRESLEKMPPLQAQDKDSYRYYGIALATEALAYAAAGFQAYEELIKTAALYYVIAIKLNPEERYFLLAQKRISEAIANPSKTVKEASNSPKPVKEASNERVFRFPSVRKAPDPIVGTGVELQITNLNVVELVKSGLDEENLIWLIKRQRQVQFDLSVDGMKYLLNNKVTNAVIAAMRERQSRTTQQTTRPQRRRP